MGCLEPTSVEKPDRTKQESLESEVVPDPMEGEQTWPTDEELREAMGIESVTCFICKFF